tara:strand:+ start:409 stop:744 length:336 start_codon:yes stop_codon:yes gene_type:complete
MTSIIIWDALPECLLNKIYSKIIYNQPKNLLEDIKSYIFIIDFIKSKYVHIDKILLYIIMNYDNSLNDNQKKEKYYFIKLKNKELNYIKRKIIKMNSVQRFYIVRQYLFIE